MLRGRASALRSGPTSPSLVPAAGLCGRCRTFRLAATRRHSGCQSQRARRTRESRWVPRFALAPPGVRNQPSGRPQAVPFGRHRLATGVTLRRGRRKDYKPQSAQRRRRGEAHGAQGPAPAKPVGTCGFAARQARRSPPGWERASGGARRGARIGQPARQAAGRGLVGLGACAARGGGGRRRRGVSVSREELAPRAASASPPAAVCGSAPRAACGASPGRASARAPARRRPGAPGPPAAAGPGRSAAEGGPPGGRDPCGDDAQVPKVAVQTQGERPRPARPGRPLPRSSAALAIALVLRRVPVPAERGR